MNVNFFEWLRDGVRQSVLLGVSDAIEQIGTPADSDDLHPNVAALLQGDVAQQTEGANRRPQTIGKIAERDGRGGYAAGGGTSRACGGRRQLQANSGRAAGLGIDRQLAADQLRTAASSNECQSDHPGCGCRQNRRRHRSPR